MRPGGASLLMLALALGSAAPARAGHGLINTFAGIPWLPAPGLTPGDLGWGLERAYERWSLSRLVDLDARIAHLLQCARERLAEGVALLAARRTAPARQAFLAYAELLSAIEAAAAPRARVLIAQHLLEHRYILSTEHLDLPADVRAVLTAPIATATATYDRIRALLPAPARDRLFFAEEEARWAWEMAQAGAAQGL